MNYGQRNTDCIVFRRFVLGSRLFGLWILKQMRSSENYFTCDNGQEISLDLENNGIDDCSDGSTRM